MSLNLIDVNVGFGVNGIGKSRQLRHFLQFRWQRIRALFLTTWRAKSLRERPWIKPRRINRVRCWFDRMKTQWDGILTDGKIDNFRAGSRQNNDWQRPKSLIGRSKKDQSFVLPPIDESPLIEDRPLSLYFDNWPSFSPKKFGIRWFEDSDQPTLLRITPH